jgi:hypothetical protein
LKLLFSSGAIQINFEPVRKHQNFEKVQFGILDPACSKICMKFHKKVPSDVTRHTK